jgi:hypothetical protein
LAGGFDIPDVITFGPNLDIDAGFDASQFSGWGPSITLVPLDITAEVEVEANAYLQ